MSKKESKIYAWIDVESTGLDIQNENLLEVAMLVTDRQLNVLDTEGYQAVIHYTPEQVEAMKARVDPYVLAMHTETGLWDKLPSGQEASVVEQELTEYLQSFNDKPDARTRMGGSSVTFDRDFLKVHMPVLSEHFHYRIIDVSTIGGLVEGFGKKRYRKKHAHTAMGDIWDSVEEIRFYRENYFTI